MLKSPLFSFAIFVFTVVILTGCSEAPYRPVPTGYPRVEMPPQRYKTFAPQGCPYSFEIPEYATAVADTVKGASSCWYNIVFPPFNATLYLSYLPAGGFKTLHEMTEDAHTFAYKHSVKANDIIDSPFRFSTNLQGTYFNIEGAAASSLQFYVTDSLRHYMRGSLYFNNAPNPDSVAPAFNRLREDIHQMVKSLRWQ